MSRFLEALHSSRVLLMDGAMGTELQRAGIQEGDCYELWNLTHPDRVRAIHQAYADAGAEVLLTNTFQVMRPLVEWPGGIGWPGSKLSPPIPFEVTRWLIGVQWSAHALGRSACGAQGFVLADIGPLLDRSGKEFSDLAVLKQTVAYIAPRVDAVLLETCSTPRVRWATESAGLFGSGKPILLSLTYQRDAEGQVRSFSGHAPEWFAERAEKWGLAALGVNCGRDIDMDDIIEIIRRYRAVTDLPLFARPNAGSPKREGDRWVYPHTPKQMAERLPELLEVGVSMVGGCCGTTPEHIAAFREVIDRWNAGRKR